MKRVFLLSLLLVCVSFPLTSAAPIRGLDLETDDGLARSYLFDQNILEGDEAELLTAESLALDRSVNRAEFLKLLLTALAVELESDETQENCFLDVKTEWYAPYVCFSASKGWIKGYADGLFHPGAPLNQAEAAKMVSEVLSIPVADLQGGQDWYEPYLNELSERMLLESPSASQHLSRGEAAVLVFKALIASQNTELTYNEVLRNAFLREQSYSGAYEHFMTCENNDVPFEYSIKYSAEDMLPAAHGAFSFTGTVSTREGWYIGAISYLTVDLKVVDDGSEAFKYFYAKNDLSKDGELIFKLGMLEEGEFKSTADFSEDVKALIEEALITKESIVLNFILPTYAGFGPPMDFSYACEIEL